jgi:hypothetical protein
MGTGVSIPGVKAATGDFIGLWSVTHRENYIVYLYKKTPGRAVKRLNPVKTEFFSNVYM